MFKLDKIIYEKVYTIYKKQDYFFPLIGAVLLNEQDGVVYGDCLLSPKRFYVEHAFGFAQIFGAKNDLFDSALRRYIVEDKNFIANKVRLYTPIEIDFAALRSERQRFVLGGIPAKSNRQPYKIMRLNLSDKVQLQEVESNFGIVRRFWRNSYDFSSKAQAIVAWDKSKPIGICYAAAVAEGQAEIDVLTALDYRHKGIGKQLVAAFNTNCIENKLQPVWDCFTNNTGSMALGISSGFKRVRPAYSFYTFAKNNI